MSNSDPDSKDQPDGSKPPPPIEAEIFVYVEELCVAKYSLSHGEYLIGREKSCQILVEVDGVSRRHARLSFLGYELVLEDINSANGVFIDGVRLQLPTRVRREQQVEIGSARLFIRLKEVAAEMFAAALWDPELGMVPVRAMLEGKKYNLHNQIGRGGMGVVNKGRDMRIRRTVAIKSMKMVNQFSREYILRFIEEAQVTGQLQHPNIVPVYELGLDEQGEVFYTMKYIHGNTLEDVLRKLREGDEESVKSMSLASLITIYQKICDAVAFAHSKGVVHRDLKPDNIMVGEYGEVLVMDWGLAKRFVHLSEEEVAEGKEGSFADLENQASMQRDDRGFQTMNGLIVGSPPYISPEAARGDLNQVNHRSDIYVLGSILYAILTLNPPYPGTEFAQLVTAIGLGKFTPPSSFNNPKHRRVAGAPGAEKEYELAHLPGRRVPDGLSAIVVKAMQFDPKLRYERVEELQADITAWQGGFAPKAEQASLFKHIRLWGVRNKRSVWLFSIFALVLQVAVVSLFLSLRSERDHAEESRLVAIQKQRDLDAMIVQLKGSAPMFAEEARSLLLQRQPEHALDSIEQAIAQVPNNASYYLLKGNILESLLRWDDAITAYGAALERDPNLNIARGNIDFLKQLLEKGDGESEPSKAQKEQLAERMAWQKRFAEARLMRQQAGLAPLHPAQIFQEATVTNPALKELLHNRAMRTRFRKLEDNKFGADFRDLPLNASLAFLKAKPMALSSLYLDNSGIPNLGSLQGLELRHLSLGGCATLMDLTPLHGMPLERLNISGTKVTDLSQLAGMPLKELIMEECGEGISLEPLLGIPTIETLVIPRTAQNIAALKALPNLKAIGFRNPPQPAADFWQSFDAQSTRSSRK